MPPPARKKIVKARLVNANEIKEPGDFSWLCSSPDATEPDAITFMCPCGCREVMQVPLNCNANWDVRDTFLWDWNGIIEQPLMAQSIEKQEGCYSVFHLINGMFVVR